MNTVYYACKDINNFGDLFSKWLCEKVTGREFEFSEDRDLIVSGSILQDAKEHTIVMGAGFGSLFQSTIAKDIRFVRGNMTGTILYKFFDIVPDIFEPVYCLREFFENREPDIEIGYLPHYIDRPDENNDANNGWQYIDICSGIENVINQVLRCKKIITSSLHGMVLADLFERPNALVKISDKIDTDGTKYVDYWTFQGTKPYRPIPIESSDLINEQLEIKPLKFDKGIMAKTFLRELKSVCE